jgi:hypothetical protein
VSGNWEFQTTQSGGPGTFTSLAGFINQQGNSGTDSNFTTAALQAYGNSSSACYNSPAAIPLDGSVFGTQVGLRSFSVDGQFLSISATADSTGTHMTGSYVVSGGCADGAKGTITGTAYAPVTGTYSGPITPSSPAQTVRLALTQTDPGTGEGIFLITGSAAFTGFSCFTTGTLVSPNSIVIGSSISLTIHTNDSNGANVVLTGTIDPAADTLTMNSAIISGGSCQGTLGGVVLKVPAS